MAAVKTKYLPGKGASYGAAMAGHIGQLIEDGGGTLTPSKMVEVASKKRHPLHTLFEWEDSVAGEAFRIHQARAHLGHLEVVVSIKGASRQMRAAHSVSLASVDDDHQQRYVLLDVVSSDAGLASQVIDRALTQLNGWRKRYQEYQSFFADVFAAVDAANKKKKRRKKR